MEMIGIIPMIMDGQTQGNPSISVSDEFSAQACDTCDYNADCYDCVVSVN